MQGIENNIIATNNSSKTSIKVVFTIAINRGGSFQGHFGILVGHIDVEWVTDTNNMQAL